MGTDERERARVGGRVGGGPDGPMPRINVRGTQLYAGRMPWRAWGMNWGIGDHSPVLAYLDNPTSARLDLLASELRTARALGANSMRIYLELGQVMKSATHASRRTIAAFRKLLALAERERIYLDVTLLLCDQASQARFLLNGNRYVVGTFEFFDGRAPDSIEATAINDAIHKTGLRQFVALRSELLHISARSGRVCPVAEP
jgi:hypothetical protein